jgi:hypothetical protein
MKTASLVTLALLALAFPTTASAQRQFAMDARAGSGLSIGGGDGQATLRHTPTYVEAGVHSWMEEEASVVLGGALRVEVEDRASIGGVVRAGLRWTSGILELRPSIALAAILAPYTLVGPEAGVMTLLSIAPPLSLVLQIVVDGWLFGSDLAPGTVLVMVNGAVGVEIAL